MPSSAQEEKAGRAAQRVDMGDVVENNLEAIDIREFYRWIPHSISRETDLDFFKQAFLR